MWRPPAESNGLLRTSRCTPVSVRSRPNAYSPSTLIVALRMPATSPSVSSITSVLKPLRSQYLRYWRSSIAAQSHASVPPAPAWMSMKQLLGSGGLSNMRRNSSSATVASSLAASASIASRPSKSPSAFDIS